jgi:hypothetical protein
MWLHAEKTRKKKSMQNDIVWPGAVAFPSSAAPAAPLVDDVVRHYPLDLPKFFKDPIAEDKTQDSNVHTVALLEEEVVFCSPGAAALAATINVFDFPCMKLKIDVGAVSLLAPVGTPNVVCKSPEKMMKDQNLHAELARQVAEYNAECDEFDSDLASEDAEEHELHEDFHGELSDFTSGVSEGECGKVAHTGGIRWETLEQINARHAKQYDSVDVGNVNAPDPLASLAPLSTLG